MKTSILFIFMIFSVKTNCFPLHKQRLTELSQGPNLEDCPEEENIGNYYQIDNELNNTYKVISILARVPLQAKKNKNKNN